MIRLSDINKIKYFDKHLIEHVKITSSTNDDLKDLWPVSSQRIRIADEQTSGRGQLDRSWSSMKGNGIYFSFTWANSIEYFKEMLPLSMLAGAVVYEAIKKLTSNDTKELWIKWPNDIWLSNKKLGGILVESYFDEKKVNFVIGIGINIFPFITNQLAAAGLSELIAKPSTEEFLNSFFETWSEITEKSTKQQLQIWKVGANRFFNLKHQLLKPDGTEMTVKPTDVNLDGTLCVQEESGNISNLNSCQKLIPNLTNTHC